MSTSPACWDRRVLPATLCGIVDVLARLTPHVTLAVRWRASLDGGGAAQIDEPLGVARRLVEANSLAKPGWDGAR